MRGGKKLKKDGEFNYVFLKLNESAFKKSRKIIYTTLITIHSKKLT